MSGVDNITIGDLLSSKDSSISFIGKGNVLYIEPGVRLEGCNIEFKGDNSLVYLSANKNSYRVNILVHDSNIVFFGRDVYFNNRMLLIASESKNIFIGDGCLFSIGVVLRNADAHLIYDIDNKTRLNYTKSIYVGDHVWVGQNSLILKGTMIGSGSILGGGSVISNKTVSSNTIWAGNPAKQTRDNIFWSEECVHAWNQEKTDEMLTRENPFPLKYDESSIPIITFEQGISGILLSNERLNYILNNFIDKPYRMFIRK